MTGDPRGGASIRRGAEVAEQQVAAARDDGDAFAALVAPHRSRIGAIVLAMLGDPGEAEDVAQEALLVAYSDLARLRDPSRFGAWLRGIAVNLARMRLRERQRVHAVPLDAVNELADPNTAADRLFDAAERAQQLRTVLARLPAGQRDALLAHDVDGQPCTAIAAREQVSATAVRARLYRARRQLRAELGGLAPSRGKEKPTMIEVELYDVMARIPAESEPTSLLRTAVTTMILAAPGGEQVLPIWIGAAEAGSLALYQGDEQAPRPLTVDLLTQLLDIAKTLVDHIAITAIHDGVFHAWMQVAGQQIDARPSDAVNIAIRVGAPMFVDEKVLGKAAIEAHDLAARLETLQQRHDPLPQPADWRSLSPDVVLTAWRSR